MNCFEPGQVLILPSKDDDQRTLGLIGERLNQPFEIIYSIRDVILHYNPDSKIEDLLSQYGALPLIVRVPEGQELHFSTQIRSVPEVKTSVPNFRISPAGATPIINEQWVADALKRTNSLPINPSCGAGIRVAILDSGVNPTALASPEALHPHQFDAESRRDIRSELVPKDEIGHGSIVAHIVNRTAPNARLLSVKTFAQHGTVGSLLAALYLAESIFRPHIYNLSLSVSCDEDTCDVCGSPKTLALNAEQLRSLFGFLQSRNASSETYPLLVAAAGNNRSRLSMPAAFPNVIAIGSYDIEENREAEYSRYTAVPTERFFLAPGGNRDVKSAVATGGSGNFDRNPMFFGTSFATAFVTGISARYLCVLQGEGACARHAAGKIDVDVFELITEILRRTADTSMQDYTPTRHGGGLARYDGFVAQYLARRCAVRRGTKGP